MRYRNKRYLSDWRDSPSLRLLNLSYDLTPAKFISMIISEHGQIAPSSAPVICVSDDDGEEVKMLRFRR